MMNYFLTFLLSCAVGAAATSAMGHLSLMVMALDSAEDVFAIQSIQ